MSVTCIPGVFLASSSNGSSLHKHHVYFKYLLSRLQQLVGRLFYPSNREITSTGAYKKAKWVPSWEYARGYGAFLTAWGKPSLAKTLLRPVITLTSYWLGHHAMADNFLVRISM